MKPTSSTQTSRAARADYFLRPALGTPLQGPRHPPRPAPAQPTRTWTITTTNGYAASGHLPPWAEDDPSRTAVRLDRLHIELADITHHTDVGGLVLPVSHATKAAQESGLLAVTIDCKPYPDDEDHGPQLPVINVQIIDDFWIRNLDPPGAVAFGEQLRALGELIINKAAPLLTTARTEWTDHTAPNPSTTPTRPRKLNQEPSAATWAREKAGLTKRALAKLVGISEQLMNDIESGRRNATPANLTKIATALNFPAAALERTRPDLPTSTPAATSAKLTGAAPPPRTDDHTARF